MEPFKLAREKFKLAKKMMFDKESIEIATPEIIANYRAKRLTCDCIIDMCCGIGGDTIALTETCKDVIAIDINNQMIDFAKHNCKIHGKNNVSFIQGNVLEIDLKKFNANYAFSDPTRRINGKRVKELSETIPPIDQIIKKIMNYKGFCIEVSQQLKHEEIPYDCEREYLSYNGECSCLSLYFGNLKKCERSAVILPLEVRIESKYNQKKPIITDLKKYFYEIDPAIIKADLISELSAEFNLTSYENFLTSDEKIISPYMKNSFELLDVVKKEEIISTLKSLNANKVVLRGKLDPHEQPILKRKIDSCLSGKEKLHVFFNKKIIIAQCLNLK
jgi:precorrin-6B methylase 2